LIIENEYKLDILPCSYFGTGRKLQLLAVNCLLQDGLKNVNAGEHKCKKFVVGKSKSRKRFSQEKYSLVLERHSACLKISHPKMYITLERTTCFCHTTLLLKVFLLFQHALRCQGNGT